MGIKEYNETGGNSRLIKNHNQEKEKSLSNSMATFSRFDTQQYGFDSYEELKQAISNEYPTLDNGYRTPFKSIESYRYDRVDVDNPDGFTFRTEMGVPLTPQQGTLSLMGSSGGSTTALYAYQTDQEGNEQVAGKLNLVSFDKIINKVHIIPVNNANISNEKELERRLNEIYGQAVATWEVIKEPNLTVNFPNGSMLHGSMSAFSVYNADHKLIAKTYENSNRRMEKGEYYLFYIDGVTFKERSLAGYMPLGYQAGYIYDNPRIEIVAHELGHGAFSLRHTFSPDAFIYGEGKTQNLMDYGGGTDLWHHQWQEIHNPNKLLFGWAQDEEEGEMIRNEKVSGIWKSVSPPEMIEGKKELTYNKIFVFDDTYVRNTHKLVQLLDKSKFLVSPSETSESIITYKLKPEGIDDWAEVQPDWFSSDCLSCELNEIAKVISKESGKIVGRYILPVEDVFILITGEDFDNEEASRIAAGGFVILEVVQVGKVFKLVKGAKVFSKTGKAVNVSKRVVKLFTKEVSKEAALDMSIQFFVNLINEIIQNPDSDGFDLAINAFTKIDIKDAVVAGMIDFASIDKKTQASFDCALRLFRQFENVGEVSLESLEKGVLDCVIIFVVRHSFGKIKNTEQINKLSKAITDVKNYDIIINKLSEIMTAESVEKYIQTLIEYGLSKGANNIWE